MLTTKEQLMQDILEEYKGDWAVIITNIGGFIGRIVAENDKEINLQPVFDYISQPVQQNDGSIARNVMVLPHDICSTLDSTLRIRDKELITKMLFADMSGSDRDQYASITRKGADIAVQASAAKSGLTLANNVPKQ